MIGSALAAGRRIGRHGVPAGVLGIALAVAALAAGRRTGRHGVLAGALGIALAVAACAGADPSPPGVVSPVAGGSPAAPSLGPGSADPAAAGSPGDATLMVFAAASLRRAFEAMKPAYEAGHPGIGLAFAFDSSSALEAQIEQGAPADVFASADTKNPQKLVDGGFAAGAAVLFAGNRLTIVTPATNPAGVTSALDLARPGVKVVAAGDAVPITGYADQVLASLAGRQGYPSDFAARVESNVVSREDNVAAVVAKVQLGEGDAAIVYVTDAEGSPGLARIDLPTAANAPAAYTGVVVKGAASTEAATTFLRWLAGPGGQAILGRFGFLPP